jgi:AcrR family transcriptional regulator
VNEVNAPGRSQAQPPDRTERILEAAADLLLRYGYKRITVEDIAEQAGVGKGTIYLHWKTREALFGTLLLREAVAVWREMLERLRADPAEALLHRLMRSLLLITRRRPLARALFTGDGRLLGKLAQSEAVSRSRQAITAQEFLPLLRSLGLVRADVALVSQLYAFGAVLAGFALVDPLLADEVELSLEEKAEALARTIQLAFEPEVLPPAAALPEIAARLIRQFEQVIAAYERRLQELAA